MPSFIRAPKDFWSGVIFIVVGLMAVYIGRDYSMGSAARMGPAYFPTILGGMLTAIGAISVGRSMFRDGEPIGTISIKNIILVLGSVVAFAFLVRGAGLFIAVVLTVMVSGLASSKFRLLPFVAVAVGLAVFGILVFVYGLGLPMPAFGPWFGF